MYTCYEKILADVKGHIPDISHVFINSDGCAGLNGIYIIFPSDFNIQPNSRIESNSQISAVMSKILGCLLHGYSGKGEPKQTSVKFKKYS